MCNELVADLTGLNIEQKPKEGRNNFYFCCDVLVLTLRQDFTNWCFSIP
jgi:hypothetical protein